MRIALTSFAFISIVLFSCQKEVDFANKNTGGTGGDNAPGLLVKTVQQMGSDSLVTVYGYDSNKKLISLKKTGVDDQGDPVNTEYHFHRTASGIIRDYSTLSPDLVSVGIDSITTVVHSSSSRYTSYVISVNIPGFVLLDSSAFAYDASGRITTEKFYESPSGSGSDYYLSGIVNYTYSGSGNVAAFDIHDLDQSGSEIFTAATSNITYDSKINPLQIGNEGLLLEHPEWTSVNNILSEQGSDSNGPADDQTATITYTYNSSNKPIKGVTTITPGNTVSNTLYYYQ